jgi:hypothetical protein
MAKNKIETTLGDLIVLLTEEAERFSTSQQEKYRLAAGALTHLLAASRNTLDANRIRRHVQLTA